MENFTFKSPTQFIFGMDTHKRAGKYVAQCGGKRALVLYGGGSVLRSGVLHEVVDSLDAAGVDCVTLGGVQPNPGSSFVYKAIETAREARVDFLLAGIRLQQKGQGTREWLVFCVSQPTFAF